MNKIDYDLLLGGDYFAGKCVYIDECLDIGRLRKSEISGNVDEDLADQYHELCSVGGRCLIKKSLGEK